MHTRTNSPGRFHRPGFFLSLLLLTLLLGACRASPVLETVAVIEPAASPTTAAPRSEIGPAGYGWGDHTLFQEGLVSARQFLSAWLDGATEYQLDVNIDPALENLTGTQAVRYTNRASRTLTEVFFRVFPNFFAPEKMVISALEVEGRTVEPVFSLADTLFSVRLPAPLAPGDSVTISFNFTLPIPSADEAPFSIFGYGGGILTLDQFFPTVVVYDEGGWAIMDPPQWEENAYADASFFLLRVTLPDDLVAIGAGIEVDRQVSAGRQTLTFAAGPARGFALVAGEGLVVRSETVGETTIHSYTTPGREPAAESALGFAAAALSSFNRRLGAYPYTEFDLISTPMQASGSASAGIVVINRAYYEEGGVIVDVPALNDLERTVAHELAHQWFFNLVGSDYAQETWFPEGFAQYMTGRYYLDVYGRDELALYERDWFGRWSEAGSREIPIGLPIQAYSGPEPRAILYGRAPIFIDTLAGKLSQDVFDTMLFEFVGQYAWDLAGAAEFRAAAESACTCSLETLFEAWVYPDPDSPFAEEEPGGQTFVIQPGLPFDSAQESTEFELLYPAFFPEDFAFYGANLHGQGEASLNFVRFEEPQRVAVLVQTLFGASSQFQIVMDEALAQIVRVNGLEAVWFFDPVGNDALLDWSFNGVRYRLVGILDLEIALQIAESLE